MNDLEFVQTNVDMNKVSEQPELIYKKEKTSCNEKKVHWSGKYVDMLLDCVESRMGEFKNKTIHKKVWDEIGQEMMVHGFSTEHCYNKWKNLRRDVRMVAMHPGKGARNEQTLCRVQHLISSICPSFDPRACNKKIVRSPQKQSEGSSNSLEPLGKLLTPATSPFSDSGSAGCDSRPLGEGRPVVTRPNLYPLPSAASPISENLFLTTAARVTDPSGHTSPASNCIAASHTSWPYELYDLLVKFRAEELSQAQSIAHMTRQIGDIRDCSVRRMNTIQQLINLAHVLINSKVS